MARWEDGLGDGTLLPRAAPAPQSKNGGLVIGAGRVGDALGGKRVHPQALVHRAPLLAAFCFIGVRYDERRELVDASTGEGISG
jgi:hypothetical protein